MTRYRRKGSPLTGGKRVHPKTSNAVESLGDSHSPEFMQAAASGLRGKSERVLAKVEGSLPSKYGRAVKRPAGRVLDLSERRIAAEIMEDLLAAGGEEVLSEHLTLEHHAGGLFEDTGESLNEEVREAVGARLFATRVKGGEKGSVFITQNPDVKIEREGAPEDRRYRLSVKKRRLSR